MHWPQDAFKDEYILSQQDIISHFEVLIKITQAARKVWKMIIKVISNGSDSVLCDS
jgi:hypothetical protein